MKKLILLFLLFASTAYGQAYTPGLFTQATLAGSGTDQTNKIVLIAGAGSAGAVTLTLPNAYPASNGYVLSGTTGGTLSWVAQTSGFADPMTSTGDMIYSSDNTPTPARLAIGSSNQILTVSGGIPAWTTATYPATGGTSGTILRSNGTNFLNSTTTWPNTTTANQILYSSATSTVGEITTANNGVLITSGAGVPSISATLPAAVQGNITATGTLTSGTAGNGFTQTFLTVVTNTPTALASNTNNYAITTTYSTLYLTASSAVNLTGIAAGSDGQEYTLINNGTNTITLKDQSASSSAGNKFLFFSGDQLLAPNAIIRIIYDGTSSTKGWRCLSHN